MAIWALRAFQVGLSTPPYLVVNGDVWFIEESRERDRRRQMPWKHQNGGHFVSYLAYIIGAKFEWDHSNILVL